MVDGVVEDEDVDTIRARERGDSGLNDGSCEQRSELQWIWQFRKR